MESLSIAEKTQVEGHHHPVIKEIRARAYQEVINMAMVLNKPVTGYPFSEIVLSLTQLLDQTAVLWSKGEIDPFAEIRTSRDDAEKLSMGKTLRIGIYPVAANPLHWAHVLIGLSALVKFRLDKIIYVISGSDPRKPELISAEIRYLIGKKVFDMFAPLFGYSPIALGDYCDGEINIFKILALNPQQKIDAFYIVGADHYHRINPVTGNPDTIQKLENNITRKTHSFNAALHSVSAIFIERGSREQVIETDLNVSFIPEISFTASSTMIREAFQGIRSLDTLALLPFTAYRYADELGIYGAGYESTMNNKNHCLQGNEKLQMSRENNWTACPAEGLLYA